MTDDPPGGLTFHPLLAGENSLFRLSLSITGERLDSVSRILAEGFMDACAAVFKSRRAGIKRIPWEFSILLCGDGLIRDLNRQYRGIDAPTDVLSFETAGEGALEAGNPFFFAGEIVISLDTLAANSAEFGVSENEELKRLVIHGILHLNGMDHLDNSPEQEMLKIQESILETLGDVILLK